MLMVVDGCCWLRTVDVVSVGCSWLLVVVGGCWWLLAVVGCRGLLVVGDGGLWMLLDSLDDVWSWLLLIMALINFVKIYPAAIWPSEELKEEQQREEEEENRQRIEKTRDLHRGQFMRFVHLEVSKNTASSKMWEKLQGG